MDPIQLVGWAVVLLGHTVLCVALFNRILAAKVPARLIGWFELLCLILIVMGAAIWGWWGFGPPHYAPRFARLQGFPMPVLVYVFLAAQLGCLIPIIWFARKLTARQPQQLLSNHTQVFDVRADLTDRGAGLGARIVALPGNESLQLEVREKQLVLETLPPELDGFSIAHLSDLHLTGYVPRSYFEFVIERTEALEADLIAITGDVLDHQRCLDWIPSTLGKLQAPFGVFYILGNHDQRHPDPTLIRRALSDCGLADIGGRSESLSVAQREILLTGNERPWFPASPPSAELTEAADLRLLIAHSPDQIRWARRHGFELMLAGHTHGGQVRFPVVGPVVSPSHYGVKYTGGVYYEAPTLLHVTRGVSAQIPLRWNCPPEVAKLVLRCP